MNLDELNRVLDGARQAPLSEADHDKLKGALHALAAMLAPPWNTEKTSAALGNLKVRKPVLRRMATHPHHPTRTQWSRDV